MENQLIENFENLIYGNKLKKNRKKNKFVVNYKKNDVIYSNINKNLKKN